MASNSVQSNISGFVSPFTGATSGVNGGAGSVPAPSAGLQNNFLRADGTWATANFVSIGNPEGVTVGNIGHTYYDTVSTIFYIKASGANTNVGWVVAAGPMVGASSTVAGGRGIVPVPAIGDNSKLLTGAGTWGTSLIAKRAFTSGTTYTPTSGTNKIICYVIGGGGGGGACIASINTTQGSGGAAGAVVGFVESVSDQTTYTYSIGGAGASSTIGGNTSIVVNGNTYTSNGGNPGTDGSGFAPSVSGGGVGGTTVPGVVTGNAFLIADGGVGGYGAAMGSNVHASGQGGSNMFGSGGRSAVTNAAGSSVGTSGNGLGAGGSGARQNNSTAVAGGAGSGGAIIIFEIR